MKGISKLSLAIAMAGYGMSAVAAVEDPGHIRWNGIDITPQLKTDIGYDDNVFREGSGALKKKGSSFYSIDPSVEFKAQTGLSTYAVTLAAKDMNFTSESDAGFTDYGILGDIHQEFNSRNRLDVDWDYGVYHDSGSTVNGVNDKNAPEYVRKKGGLKYGFGSTEAMARVDLFGSIDKRDYEKTRGIRGGENRETKEYGATFFYRLMPKTDALFEVKKRDLEYERKLTGNNAGKSPAYDITSYLVGLNWEATAKTTGYAKIGRRYRETDLRDGNNQKIDKEGYTGWEVGVSYMPVDHSVFQLSTTRDYGLEYDEPSEQNFTKGTTTTVAWMHDWTSRIGTNVNYSYTDEEVQSALATNEKDRKVKTFGVSVDWKVQRFVTLSLGYQNTDRDESNFGSGASDDSYRRNIYTLSAELAI